MLRHKIINIIRGIIILKRLLNKEIKSKNTLTWKAKIFCYTKGFFSDSYILYDFQNNDYKKYLTDIQENIKSRHINQKRLVFIDNKLLFPLLLKPFLPLVQENLMIMEGKPVKVNESSEINDWDTFLDNMEETQNSFILKEVDGVSGYGIYKLTFNGGSFFLNQRENNRKTILSFLSSLDNYLISPWIDQLPYASNIFPKTVNTVRILTMIAPDSGKSFIAAAAHRIGTEQSFPVDNCAMGGLTAVIELRSGTLGKAVSTKVNGKILRWHTHHPDSGSLIEGVEVPHWDQLKETILEVAQNLSFIPYIGWDIVVQEKGFVIIEGNDGPDIKLHQVHAPLLNSPQVKRFYQYHKVI